jgi:hypothetical protein
MSENAMIAKVLLGALAARLTTAAYPIAARHGIKNFWVDLAIDLWTTLRRLRYLEGELARADWESWRERLTAELADAAYRVTLEYGAMGSFIELGWACTTPSASLLMRSGQREYWALS